MAIEQTESIESINVKKIPEGIRSLMLSIALLIDILGFIPIAGTIFTWIGQLGFIVWFKIYGIGYFEKLGARKIIALFILPFLEFITGGVFPFGFILYVAMTISIARGEYFLIENSIISDEDLALFKQAVQGDVDFNALRERGKEHIVQAAQRKKEEAEATLIGTLVGTFNQEYNNIAERPSVSEKRTRTKERNFATDRAASISNQRRDSLTRRPEFTNAT